MTPSQESVTGRLFLVIGIVISGLFMSTFLNHRFYEIAMVNVSKQNAELKTINGVVKTMSVSIATYLLGIIIAFTIAWLLIFMYFVFFIETTVSETFARSIVSFKDFFWLNGQMIFAYTPLILSILLVFTMFILMFLSNKDALKSLKFASLTDKAKKNTLQEDENRMDDDTDDVPTLDLDNALSGNGISSDVESFQRHVLLLIFLSAIFVYIIILVPLWSSSKLSFAVNMTLIFGIIICTLATYNTSWVAILSYLLVAIGYLYGV